MSATIAAMATKAHGGPATQERAGTARKAGTAREGGTARKGATARGHVTDRGPLTDRRDTRQLILDISEQLVQVRGFNAFSYADVAAELGITKASLHYHFPGKAELGQALIARYAQRFEQALDAIDAGGGAAPRKLSAYAKLYADVLRRHRMCLCGMLAAEYETLPDPIRVAVHGFFDNNERWLSRVLRQGRSEHTLEFEGSARATARMIISGLEGAMLVARTYDDGRRFGATSATLLAGLAADGHKPPSA
jgi:TetR/AcrR family transcriptional repressor of nem operon